MSGTPIPAPRLHAGEAKKPVPTPRRTILEKQQKAKTEDIIIMPNKSPPDEHNNNNTFSRRVRSLSHASKQIAGDIGEMVQDKKKAMIEGTRQSVRRITRRFNSYHSETSSNPEAQEDEDINDMVNIFNSISFQSPISSSQSIYNNVSSDSSSDEFNAPPPSHPPPPLPNDAIYDAPSSMASGSTTSTSDLSVKPEIYETVFPTACAGGDPLSRSGSWKFYDPVTKIENIYSDIDAGNGISSASTNGTSSNDSPLAPSTPSANSYENFDLNSNLSSVDVQNSVYENHVIVSKRDQDKMKSSRERPSDSVMLLFDPLRNQVQEEPQPPASPLIQQTSGDLNRQLEELLQQDLQGDLFGDIANTLDDWSISNESEDRDADFINPPPPPVRVDSLPDDEQQQPQQQQHQATCSSPTPRTGEKSRSHWFALKDSIRQSPIVTATNEGSRKSVGWLKKFKLHGVKDGFVVQRPELEIKSFVHKKGMLYKVQNGPVEDIFGEYSGRWCDLQNSNLTCYSDNSCETVKEHFPADSILSIQILQDPKFKYKYDNDDLHCFELNTTGKSRGGHIYGTRDISERRVWMQCIAESLTKKFSTKITTDYTRMGWAYLREGVSGKWLGAWIMLSHRTLYYAMDNQPIKSMDLRKVRCIVPQVYQENDNNPRTNDKGPNMVVDSPNMTLYLRMWTSRETKVWCHIVKLAAHNNGANLDQQQLTKNNIPVLVEKCINFIYAHGSMSEGIYRRPGIGSAVSEILTKFRKDAWAVQLIRDKYTEYDVATALKRFFRDLPEPLLSSNQRKYFYQVSLVQNEEEKTRMYKAGLDQLPSISFRTAKKLFGHLHFIASQSGKNLMTTDNLASFWGPTLMHYDDKDSVSHSTHTQDAAVVKQLIAMYPTIFPEDPAEIEQEKLMLKVLEKYSKSPQGAVKDKMAGDFRVWIYLQNKEGKTFNVSIGPNKTAYDVCVELSAKADTPVHLLILEEVVLGDKLTRPVHHTEKVLDVVLRWGYWDESDRKDNHLILTNLNKYYDFIENKLLPVVSGELRFADSKNRNFKPFMFEFSQAKLTCFKDRTCEHRLFTWNVEDVIWYLGHESKRNPQSIWTVTFVETKTHPKRTKNSPYFGNIMAWSDPTTRASWLAAMLKARYQDSLTPPAMHVNLISN